MSLQSHTYDSINDAQDEPAPCTWLLTSGWKLRGAISATLTLAVWLLAIAGSAGHDEATPDPAVPLDWQQQQPLVAGFPTVFSQTLVLPDERSSKNGELRTTLRVAPEVARAGPLAPPLNVRAYEGSVPGPTLRIKPGDRMVINLVNLLGQPEGGPRDGDDNDDGSFEGKIESWPNVTNLHVHGLHVSPSGVGDNIYRRAGPSDALEYVYDLPADHYPGTFYYHPHFDGSSSVQTLGGMSGAIVVEDPPGSLSPAMEAMREMVVILQETNIQSGSLRNYDAASKIAGSEMPLFAGGSEAKAYEASRAGHLLHFVTVNGQYQPVLDTQPGEVVRLRLVHGGNNDHMHISLVQALGQPVSAADVHGEDPVVGGTNKRDEINGNKLPATNLDEKADAEASAVAQAEKESGCTLLTLARDGVYLPVPRKQGGGIGHLVLTPGSRADVAVSCERAGMYRFLSSKGNGELLDEQPLMEYLGNRTDVFEGTLAFLDVGGDSMDMELPTEMPAGGRLLQDLRELPADEVSRFVFEFNEGDKVSRLNQTYTWYGVNGVQYDVSRVSRRARLGSVEEWVVVNKRLGRGEGEKGCPPPTETSNDYTNKTEGRGETGGNRRLRGSRRAERPPPPETFVDNSSKTEGHGESGGSWRLRGTRRAAASQPEARGGDKKDDDVEGAGFGELAEADGDMVDCARGGSGKPTDDTHPFHLHVNHFQVVGSSWGDEGPDWNVGDWRDTISIPSGGNVTVRWRADDFTGKSVAHCHIFGHSDTGMMMNFEIFDGNEP